MKIKFRFMVCENETLFIFAPCYGSITAQRYEIINKIGNKPISKIEKLSNRLTSTACLSRLAIV